MKVLYDYQAFEMQDFGGVSKCFCELISNLPEDVKTEIAIKQSNNVHLKESKLVDGLEPFVINEKIWRAKIHFRRTHQLYLLLTRFGLLKGAEYYNHGMAIKALKEQNFDVFHPTFFNSYFLKYLGEKPWVFTIHDLMPELFPQFFGTKDEQILFKEKYLKYASAVVAVSNTTKQDLMRIVGIPDNKITVIYHGGPEIEVIKDKPLIEEPYFLYVGMRSSYKNFKQTVFDFKEFHKEHKDVKLVCTGSDFTLEEKQLFVLLGLNRAIVHFKANDIQLKNLYANAIAFIYPSLYEGFGMPILEAYAYGCPVMLNDIPVFREIADDAAMFFKSNEQGSDLSKLLEDVFNLSAEERQEMITNGYNQLSKYSWKKSAEKLADLYKSLI